MSTPPHVFVPSPNDNYSPLTGSANSTRLYEISRRHIGRGGRARFIMGREAHFHYPTGECVRVDYPPQLNAKQRRQDLIAGWLGRPRHLRAARYLPAAQALEPDFAGPVFLYNDAAGLAHFRARCPNAKLLLYCGNLIWKTFSRREVREALHLVDRMICISEFLAADLRKRVRLSCSNAEYSRLAEKIVVIHNGVDLETFHPAGADKSTPAPPLVLFVGRIQPVKGAHVLIEAAKILQQSGRDFRLRIVGSRAFSPDTPLTPYEEKLRALAAPLGEKIEFQPFVNRHHIADEYRAADIFCMPSVWPEPFGMTLLEGMATGLPTVASSRGAIPEIGGDALLYFQPSKPKQLAQVLSGLIDDAAARREWGLQARARAEEFSWDRHYCKLAEVVAEILPAAPG